MLCGACNLLLHDEIENFLQLRPHIFECFGNFSGELNTFYCRFAFISLIKRYYHHLIFGSDKSSSFRASDDDQPFQRCRHEFAFEGELHEGDTRSFLETTRSGHKLFTLARQRALPYTYALDFVEIRRRDFVQ